MVPMMPKHEEPNCGSLHFLCEGCVGLRGLFDHVHGPVSSRRSCPRTRFSTGCGVGVWFVFHLATIDQGLTTGALQTFGVLGSDIGE